MKRLQEKKIYELDGGKVIVEDGVAQLTLRVSTTVNAGWSAICTLPVKSKYKIANVAAVIRSDGGYDSKLSYIDGKGNILYVYSGTEEAGTYCFSLTYEVA